MNIQDAHRTFVNAVAKKSADAQDSAVFAMIEAQYAAIVARGDDPTEYEVVRADDSFPRLKSDGSEIRFSMRFGVIKRSKIEAMPQVREVSEDE